MRKQRRLKVKDDVVYNFDLIGRYFYNNEVGDDANIYEITDNISEDIDLNKVFQKIDYTSSCIGRQYLYAKIRTIDYNKKHLLQFNELVQYFREKKASNEQIKKQLSSLSSDEGYYFQELFQGDYFKSGNLILPYISAGLFVVILILAFSVNPLFFLGLAPLYCYNMILYLKNKKNINYYHWNITELRKTIKAVKSLIKEPLIREKFSEYDFFMADLNKLKSRFFSSEKTQANDFITILSYFIDIIYIAFNLEVIFFTSYLNNIISKKDSVQKLFVYVGEIDSVLSVCDLYDNNQLCNPAFTNSKYLKTEELTHPLIPDCVTNSIELNNKSLLLTGSNMSGKTTFIRAFAINSILAQTIFCCFAKSYNAPFLTIFTSIRISDNVEESTSYFFKELLIIKEFLDNLSLDKPCLFIMDEIFKGTNTLERVSAGCSILSYLNNSNHFVFASTHDIELADLLYKDNFELFHFCEQIEDDKLIFDYKLKKGKLTTRNALKILKLYDFPQKVIIRALEIQAYLLNGLNSPEVEEKA